MLYANGKCVAIYIAELFRAFSRLQRRRKNVLNGMLNAKGVTAREGTAPFHVINAYELDPSILPHVLHLYWEIDDTALFHERIAGPACSEAAESLRV